MYLVNVITQFCLLNIILGNNYYFWGFQIVGDLWNGLGWMESQIFPRVTMCDFAMRYMGNVHNYTIQCVLMINMYNEKIYLFIWFWYLFVATSTILSLFYYLIPLRVREYSIRELLKSSVSLEDPDVLKKFVSEALKLDGILLLHFVKNHVGVIVAKDLFIELFYIFDDRIV